jgi:hypothetical protein
VSTRGKATRRTEPRPNDLCAALELQAEFNDWRREAGLNPDWQQMSRLERWTKQAAKACGVAFAPWSVLE